MKRFLSLLVVSFLVLGAAGCHGGGWWNRPAAGPAMGPFGGPLPEAAYGDPMGPPVATPGSCGPGGCASAGNTPPVLSGPQGFLPVPGR